MRTYADIGSYVTGKLKKSDEIRQGVLIGFTPFHRAAIVDGTFNTYLCYPDVAVVPDDNVFGTARMHLDEVRRELKE